MKAIGMYRRSFITFTVIVLCILFLSECVSNSERKAAPEPIAEPVLAPVQFAGSESCRSCHKNIYESHQHTAHYLTSQPATEEHIKGTFTPGKNSFAFNDFVRVAMEKRDSGFFQVEYINGVEKMKRRFDIVVGSGARGQTYISWVKNRLFQLPIFYFTAEDEWCNSPGYPGKVLFNRPITSRCLECHTTYVQKISAQEAPAEEYNHAGIVYGVDCEKCHGPAVNHVAYHQQNPTDSIGKYIVNPASFSRKQSLDLCTLCHGGRLTKTRPSFSFQAGDTLSNYFVIDTMASMAASIDVHGNQYGLLSASKCFRSSDMTCMSCHNPHVNERGKKVAFSQRCMSCHNQEHNNFCKVRGISTQIIEQNCPECHMPEQLSKAIVFLEQGQTIPKVASMRSHFIEIYPDETKKFLEGLKKLKNVSNHKQGPGR